MVVVAAAAVAVVVVVVVVMFLLVMLLVVVWGWGWWPGQPRGVGGGGDGEKIVVVKTAMRAAGAYRCGPQHRVGVVRVGVALEFVGLHRGRPRATMQARPQLQRVHRVRGTWKTATVAVMAVAVAD